MGPVFAPKFLAKRPLGLPSFSKTTVSGSLRRLGEAGYAQISAQRAS